MLKNVLIGLGLGLGVYMVYRAFVPNFVTTADGEGEGLINSLSGDFLGVSNALMGEGINMQISLRGLAHIKGWEGFRAQVYLDQAGKPTIGYGHLIKPYETFTTITEAEASALLAKDVSSAEAAVNRGVKVAINQNQFDALVSFAFNVGNSAFANSTLLKRINAGQFTEAANEFGRWVFITLGGKKVVSNGLVNRRVADYNLFRGVA